jgi:predicted DNA-binding transcriptional regulator YafY
VSRSIGRAARLREIENLLFHHAEGMRVTEIAGRCDVDRRTIYRDIDLLSDAGVPIWQSDGRYGIVRDQYLATIRLSFHEAIALYIATRLLSRQADEHNPHTVSALNKIATAFPRPLADHISRTAEAIRARPTNPTHIAILETVSLCWAEHHKVKLWYRSPSSGEVSERVLAPYLIETSSSGAVYVIGFDDSVGELRTFNLDRLERASRLPDAYTIPADFDPARHLADAWGIMAGDETVSVELIFSPQVSSLIHERIWHSSQQLEPLADGSIRFVVTVSDYREMRPWIRSWGGEVEVIRPDDLRQELVEESRRLYEMYHSE